MDESAAVAAPHHETLRIQAAAVVAQQAALDEQELRLVDREAALGRQEEQLAARLEDQRRQLLDLQDQITEARSALREKRAAHAALAEQQQKELATAREEAAESLRSAKGERRRLFDLRRRLIQRGRRHWQARRKEADARDAQLHQQMDRLAADREAFVAQVEQVNGQTELDKRRLRDAWGQFERERREWQDRRDAETAAAAAQVRDLARRAKAVAAAERKIVVDRTELGRELADRRIELEQLETRIGNARWRLLEQQGEAIGHETRDTRHEELPLVSPVTSLVPSPSELEMALQRRTETLTRAADELADQRLHLTEQVERLLRTQQAWHADRNAALRDLETIGIRFEARELDLDRRGRELQAARAGVRAEYQSAAQLRLRLEAERVRLEARDAERRTALDARWSELDTRERVLLAQEDNWRSLLRRWGRRRRIEIQRLRAEHEACRAERGEWVAARTVWLRLTARLRDERRIVAARALAVEQWRSESAKDPVAAKRMERLERQWFSQCESMANDLSRLQATIKTEAGRLDERSRQVRQDIVALEARAAVLDNRAAEIEREEQVVAAERERTGGDLDAARARQDAAEARAAAARDEAERLARLLIDSAPQATAAESSQAA
jgi:chromosome segregation ATPase